jgi:hypothetical protein
LDVDRLRLGSLGGDSRVIASVFHIVPFPASML